MITIEERLNKLEGLISSLLDGVNAGIRVALPAKVTGFNASKQTVSCIPLIRELVNINGKVSYKELPELQDVPIVVPRAGNWAITLPIKTGDECMVIFQDLCIDGWWSRGGIQNWNDLRRHDLSDAIAIFSPWSQPNAISSYSSSNLEIRSLDNTIKISFSESGVTMDFPQGYTINGDGTINGNITMTGDITQTGNITQTGDITSSGTIKGQTEVEAGPTGIKMSIHTHQYNPGPGSATPTGGPQ